MRQAEIVIRIPLRETAQSSLPPFTLQEAGQSLSEKILSVITNRLVINDLDRQYIGENITVEIVEKIERNYVV